VFTLGDEICEEQLAREESEMGEIMNMGEKQKRHMLNM
jgi:hypothetical protein